MPNDSMRTVLVALGAGLGVAVAKAGAAAFTASTALAAEAAHSLADTGNDLSLFVAQRRSSAHAGICGEGCESLIRGFVLSRGDWPAHGEGIAQARIKVPIS
jgi:hypothetical protein